MKIHEHFAMAMRENPTRHLNSCTNFTRPSILEEAAYRIAQAVDSLHPRRPQLDISPRAFIVGGWTRDYILGRKSSDLDMEVLSLTKNELTRVIREAFPDQLLIESKEEKGPLKLVFGQPGCIDITVAQYCQSSGNDNLSAGPFGILEHIRRAAERRDFTCNAIYFDPLSGKTFDPNGGIDDIEKGILRLNGRYFETPLQERTPLRASRLEAQLNFRLDQRSLKRITQTLSSASSASLNLSGNAQELRKFICSPECPSLAIRSALQTGLLPKLFPSIPALKGVLQDVRHHPEGDAFEHTMLAVDAAAMLSRELEEGERYKIILAALYHDVGKASTTRVEDGKGGEKRIVSPNHARESEALAWRELRNLGLSREVCGHVCRMVKNHMRPLELSLQKVVKSSPHKLDNQVRQLVRDVHPASFDSFLMLCRADQLGRDIPAPLDKIQEIVAPIEDSYKRNNFHQRIGERLLKGADLDILGFNSLELSYQNILSGVEKLRDEGRLRTSSEAHKYVLKKHALSPLQVKGAGIATNDTKRDFYRKLSEAVNASQVTTVQEAQAILESFKNRPLEKSNEPFKKIHLQPHTKNLKVAPGATKGPENNLQDTLVSKMSGSIELPLLEDFSATTFATDTSLAVVDSWPAISSAISLSAQSQIEHTDVEINGIQVPASGSLHIKTNDSIPGFPFCFEGEWSYSIRTIPADVEQRMREEFAQLRQNLPMLSGVPVDLSEVELTFLTTQEAYDLRLANRQVRLQDLPIRFGDLDHMHEIPLKEVIAFYCVSNKTVYVLRNHLENEPEWETKSILGHELAHALQVIGFPNYHRSIDRLLSHAMVLLNKHPNVNRSEYSDIAKSITARNEWLERHARYFEGCAYQYLLDDVHDFVTFIRYAVNHELWDSRKLKNSPDKRDADDIVYRLFTTPELADLLFRDDGVVYVDESGRNYDEIQTRIADFARRYLKNDRFSIRTFNSRLNTV